MAKLDPGVVAWLLANLFEIKVPDYHHARAQPTDVRVMVPRTYHAYGMLVFCDVTDRPALSAALQGLSSDNAILYYYIILAGLPEAPRVRWEAYMTATVGSEYRSELFQELAARNQAIGEARGEARGEAKAVLTVLNARGIAVPVDVREQILACTDLAQLDTWLCRAGTATTTDEVLHG